MPGLATGIQAWKSGVLVLDGPKSTFTKTLKLLRGCNNFFNNVFVKCRPAGKLGCSFSGMLFAIDNHSLEHNNFPKKWVIKWKTSSSCMKNA